MGRTRLAVVGLIVAVAFPFCLAEPPTAPTIVLKGALIRTQTDAGDFIGTLVIRDGKIVSVGKQAQVPAGANVIDVTNCVITPGLIDAHGILALQAAAAKETARDGSLDIVDAIDPFSDDWRDAARQGVTAVYVQPGSAGNLGGAGAVVRVGPGESAAEIALRTPAGVQISLGTPPQAPAAQASQLPAFLRQRGINIPTQPAAPPPASTTLTRHAQYDQVHGQFDAAKKYGANKPKHPDRVKELLLKSVKGEIPTVIEVHYEDDLRNGLMLANEFGLKPIFEHVERVNPLPDEIRKSRAALVIEGRTPEAIRKLALDGRKFAIGTFGSDSKDSAVLRLRAAAAVAAGFPRDRVLRALTRDAAEMFGVGDKLGRIAAGRIADLVIFAGDPLDPSVPVRITISQGRVTYESANAQTVPASIGANSSVPEKLPASYILKTTRLLNAKGEFAPGELHIINGRVAGKDAVASLPVFDLGDSPVTPGLFAAHVSMGGESAADADASEIRAADAVALDDARIRRCRDAGFLAVGIAPGSSNVIAGTTAVVRAGGSASLNDIGMKFVLTSAARSRERLPISLAGQVELIESRLRGEETNTNQYLPEALRDALLEQRNRKLQAVREGRLTACFEAATRTEIAAALRLISEFKLHGILMPRDVAESIDEIRQANVPVVLPPITPRDSERVIRGLVALGQAGVPLVFGGDADEIRTTASWLVNAGLPRQTARRGLVGQPGNVIAASSGRLQPGQAADLVIWTGDPLDSSTRPAAVVVKGERVRISAIEYQPPKQDRPSGTNAARTRRRGR